MRRVRNVLQDAAYLDMAAYQQQHSEVSSDLLPSCGDPSNLGLRMTLSMTSSLASPVDSGVALLDSDGDNTSISEATINETDNLSLRDDKEVSARWWLEGVVCYGKTCTGERWKSKTENRNYGRSETCNGP